MPRVPLPRNVIDETGARYGRLIVLSYAGYDQSDAGGKSKKPRGRHAMWKCKCNCGATRTVRGTKLRSGEIVSCGCHRSDPMVRQHYRLKLSASDRLRIAKLGGAAFKSNAAKRKDRA